MTKSFIEGIVLPAIFADMMNIQFHNRNVIKNIFWLNRESNEWHLISSNPVEIFWPLTYMAIIDLPMYISEMHVDQKWQARISFTLNYSYLQDPEGNVAVSNHTEFSARPFHHHAKGSGEKSSICLGNITKVARVGKIANIFPLVCALLNRDEMVCAKGGHFNTDAYDHWRRKHYQKINPIIFFGPDGTPLRSCSDTQIPFKKI